jgi:transposase
VFVDAMGSNLGLTRLYGRAAPGQRVRAQVPGDHGGNVSTIGALSLDGLRTGLRVPGAIEGETLLVCVEELLVPTLNRGDIVVMDNNPSHKLEEIEDAIEAAGAWGLLLPTYSPDLNPVELWWSKVKSRLRALKPRTEDELLAALTDAFASITPARYSGLVSSLWLSGHIHLKTAIRSRPAPPTSWPRPSTGSVALQGQCPRRGAERPAGSVPV